MNAVSCTIICPFILVDGLYSHEILFMGYSVPPPSENHERQGEYDGFKPKNLSFQSSRSVKKFTLVGELLFLLVFYPIKMMISLPK